MTTNLENKIEKEIDERDKVNAVTAEEKDESVLDGKMYAEMINAGAANLKAHAQEINDLNVFPIPDGDTGDNMLSTIMGGVSDTEEADESIGEAARRASDGMLLSARGNSGVILSQFFEGMAGGFKGMDEADSRAFAKAFQSGVAQAYGAVMVPAEGTILTVIREATEYASSRNTETPKEFLLEFIEEAKRSLERTPELLPVLKKAGVVDSGAAGLIYIIDGMIRAVCGETADLVSGVVAEKAQKIDLDAFGPDSVLEFGYCTELLLRLMNAKTDVDAFEVKTISDYLQTIGDSVVAVKNGSVVKIHVHTMTPYKVLEFCQQFGEYLTVHFSGAQIFTRFYIALCHLTLDLQIGIY
jgi:DAK2 domain fusion protein YloV